MTVQYYTVLEAAEILRTTPNTIRVKIREGKIPIHPLEGNPLIPKDFIDTWDINTKETFIVKKLKHEIELKDQEIQELKNIIRSMVKIGLEVDYK